MVPPNSGERFFVPHRHDRTLARLTILAALAAALVLTACGRKGGLEPPPVAAAPAVGPDGAPVPGEVPQQAFGPDGQPIAPRGPQKRIFLDWLLD